MIIFWSILGIVIYLMIGAFALGLEDGDEPCETYEVILCLLLWPLFYIFKLGFWLGKQPYRLGVWIHDKIHKEDDENA